MPSKRRFNIARVLLTGLSCWGFLLAPALASSKRVRGKAVIKAPVEAVARAPKASKTKARRDAGHRPGGTAALPPKEESDVSADPPAGHNAPAPAPAAATGAPGKPRVYTFGGLDVTGNLKAPQMLFFRGRVQQELDTSSPEKRSFLKELERTADAKGL